MSLPWSGFPPVAVGGTGGSGTRVITKLLVAGGVFMGAHLNDSGDSLDLAGFDLSWGKPYLRAELAGRRPPLEAMHAALLQSLDAHLEGHSPLSAPWGWKHPHSYLLLPWLDGVIPNLRVVHVVRDGRSMAFSSNQLQAERYGELVLGASSAQWSQHVRSIEFWSWGNGRAADYGEEHMGDRYLRVRFEDVCAAPQRFARQLINFARGDQAVSDAQVKQAAELVVPPPARAPDPWLVSEVQSRGNDALARFGYLV